MTAIEQIIRFLLEDEDEDQSHRNEAGDAWKPEPENQEYGDEWQYDWAARIGNNTYYGRNLPEILTDAHMAGAFPDYVTPEQFIAAWKSGELKRKYPWEVVKRPRPMIRPFGEPAYYADDKSEFNDRLLNAYENAMTWPEESPEREEAMRRFRKFVAWVNSQK